MQPGYQLHAAWVPTPGPARARASSLPQAACSLGTSASTPSHKRGLKTRPAARRAGHLEEVGGRAVDGQRVVKVVREVELAPARGVRQRLVRLLDRLEALLDGRLLLLARRRRAGLVGVVLQRRAPVAWPRARARTSGRALSFSLSWRSAGALATTGMSAAPAATAAQPRAPVQPGGQRRLRGLLHARAAGA